MKGNFPKNNSLKFTDLTPQYLAAAFMAEAPSRGRGRGRPRGGSGGFAQKRSVEYEDYSSGVYSKKRKIMDDVYRFLVREDLVRSVIGKGGEHIKIIKDEAKEHGIETKVSIYAQGANGTPLMEGSVDRVMSVQSTVEGLGMALSHLLPSVQIHKNFRTGTRGGGSFGRGSQKLELRLIVPSHCCSGIIGKGGSVIRRIKEETKSYIQVYTLPLPLSEEYCVRIQNFEGPDLVNTAVKIFESIADIKGKNPIIMYDPIFFNHGEYGDTGSYIDTEWYQEALRSGAAQPTPYKAIRSVTQSRYPAHPAYEEAHNYEYGYEEYVPGYGGYGEDYGYECGDPYYYDYYEYPPPVPRGGRSRAPPRGRAYLSRVLSRGFRGRASYEGRGSRTGRESSVKIEAMDFTESGVDTAGQSAQI